MKSIFLGFVFNLYVTAQSQKPLNLTLSQNFMKPSSHDVEAFTAQALQKLNQHQKKGTQSSCKIDYSVQHKVNLDQDYVCFIPPKKTFSEWVFDPQDSVSHQEQLSNDANVLNMGKEKDPNAQHKLSNDTGYTLGLNHQTTRENKDRKITFELDSKLYTARVKGPDGSYKTLEGKYYIDAYEVSRINFDLEDKSRQDGWRPKARLGIRMDSNDANGLGAKVQEKWHKNDRYSHLRYEPLPGGFSKMTVEAQVGIKRMLEADIGQFNCVASATVMGGLDSSGEPLLSTKMEAQVSTGSMGDRDSSTPLFLVQYIQEQNRTGRTVANEKQLNIGSYVYAGKKTSVYAGVGVGRHLIKGAPNIPQDFKEKIHFIHFKVNRKF